MSHGFQYDEDYLEEVELSDGSTVVLRTVQPTDKNLLQEGFRRLSPQSRYMRFFGSKSMLTEEDLRYLVEIDGVNHFALGAVRVDEIGREQGLAVARFIRHDAEPDVAEPAIAVVDEMHGKGLGSVLAHRLIEAARERGIRCFRCELLAENTRIRELIEGTLAEWPGAALRLGTEEGVVHAEIELPDVADVAPRGSRRAMRYLMGEVARGNLVARLRQSLLKEADEADEADEARDRHGSE